RSGALARAWTSQARIHVVRMGSPRSMTAESRRAARGQVKRTARARRSAKTTRLWPAALTRAGSVASPGAASGGPGPSRPAVYPWRLAWFHARGHRSAADLVLGSPAEQPPFHLPDAEGEDDPGQAEHGEGHHHVGRVEAPERGDDEVADPAARLAADELADDDADEGEGDRGGERGEGPGQGGGYDHRSHDLALGGPEEAGGVDQVLVDAPRSLEGVEEDDEEDDQPGEDDLGQEPEPEDHRDERHQRHPREGV